MMKETNTMFVHVKLLMFRVSQALLVLATMSMAAGCGVRLPANATTYPLHGKVTQNNQAFTTGVVRFEPVEVGKGIAVEGKIESDGSYKTRAFVGQQGTTPGAYNVSVVPDPLGPSAGQASQIPEKYQSGKTSGLSYTVEAKDNTYDIDLR